MKEQKENAEQNDPTPLTDEELAEFQRKESRKVGIIGTIIAQTAASVSAYAR